MERLECYIQECERYGKRCARLREKRTDRKVIISGDYVTKEAIVDFLSQAKLFPPLAPTVFDRYGPDIVAVTGEIVFDTKLAVEIRVGTMLGSGYVYE